MKLAYIVGSSLIAAASAQTQCEAVSAHSSLSGNSTDKLGDYGMVLDGVFDECNQVETQQFGFDFSDVTMSVQDEGKALALVGLVHAKTTLGEGNHQLPFAHFDMNVLIPGEFELNSDNYIVGESLVNMGYIGSMVQVNATGHAVEHPMIIEMLSKAREEGTFSFRCNATSEDSRWTFGCEGWIMHRVTQPGLFEGIPRECRSCEYENHPYSDFRIVQNQECKPKPEDIFVEEKYCGPECIDFEITVNNGEDLIFDDDSGFLQVDIVSNHDTDFAINFHTNGGHLYSSTCGLPVAAGDSSSITLTSDLVNGQPGQERETVIRLSYGNLNQCIEDVEVIRFSKEKGTCSSSGDPHTVTLDNAKHDWGNTDFVTIFEGCDLLILGDLYLTDMQKEVPLVDGADGETTNVTLSMYQGFKFQYKDTVISVIVGDDKVTRVYAETLNGAEMENILFSEKIHKFIFDIPDGSKISVHTRGNARVGVHLDISLQVSAKYKTLCPGVSSLTGICGNWNGDEVDDGYTVNNVSPQGPWTADAYRGNPTLPQSLFPANIVKLRCRNVDTTLVLVNTLPAPPADNRRRFIANIASSAVDTESCNRSADELDYALTQFFEECNIDLESEIKNCSSDLILGIPADVRHQVEISLENCPAYRRFVAKKSRKRRLKTIFKQIKS